MAELESILKTRETPSFAAAAGVVIRLSIPAIMAEITSIIMQYIDAAMVGSLGKEASAAIGLVSTSTWLIGGLCISAATGFSVQAAQLVGASRTGEARNVFRQSLIAALFFGALLSVFGIIISPHVPVWLGGAEEIRADASEYFFICSCVFVVEELRYVTGSMLQCSGDMRTPSIVSILLCILDVIFNFIFIFPSREVWGIPVFGFGMGVKGAAIGTACAEIAAAAIMLYFAVFRSEKLAFRLGGSWRLRKKTMLTALRLAVPAAVEHTVMCGAYVMATVIVAPLGTAAVAANSLAITAESFCYMPGYGIGSAATTLVGQSVGAQRKDLARRFARVSVALGVAIMTVTGVIMFIAAPFMFSLLTPSEEVRALGVSVLRIEAFAEPLYAASIVCAGALRGAGDTLWPSILNLVSMWGVRITLAMLLVGSMGLAGMWTAMCIELCFRGIIFLIRLLRERWLVKSIV